jgi:hypothetical protein
MENTEENCEMIWISHIFSPLDLPFFYIFHIFSQFHRPFFHIFIVRENEIFYIRHVLGKQLSDISSVVFQTLWFKKVLEKSTGK